MALIEINLDPSERDLKWFGVLALVFFLLVGGMVFWLSSAQGVAYTLWAIGFVFFGLYYLVKPMRRVMYRGWLKLFQPVGWVVGHALFAFIYFVVFSLIGLLIKVFGHDPMRRKRPVGAESYWIRREAETDSARYFRQF